MDALHSFPGEDRIEKVTLYEDPPYMEIRTRADGDLNAGMGGPDPLPTSTLAQKVEPSYLSSLPLGEDYEKKKQRLQQELRLDYRRYMAQKQDMSGGLSGLHSQGLSLPIAERRSAKDRLRDERNKEYNQFLRGQRHGRPSQNLQGQSRAREQPAAPRARPDLPKLPPVYSAPQPRERLPSRRDASTLTESRPGGRSRRRWGEEPGPPGRRPTRPRVQYDSQDEEEEEGYSEEEPHYLERRPRRSRRPEYAEGRGHRPEREVPRLRLRAAEDSDYPEMDHYAQRPRNDRVQWERNRAEAPPIYTDDHRERKQRTRSAAPNPKPQTPEPAPLSERARPVRTKDRAEFATGLMIGAADEGQATQARKARYRQELQEQMAEQRKNKRKEKELELRVAATGAIDPEKMPDRLKQFGAVSRDYDEKRRDVPYRPGLDLDALGLESERRRRPEKPPADPEDGPPPDRPRLAFQPPVNYSGLGAGAGQGGAAALNHDFHRGLSGALGELVVPRITGVPPPPAPTLADAYRTPYDEAYYYYGARNPLDPSLVYYGPVPGGLPTGAPPYQQSGAQTHRSSQPGAVPTGAALGVFPTERPKPTKESVRSYQEALKMQMQEKRERRKLEQDEKERYEAQLEAEMRANNPWGKGGGGAPLRDSGGNLITDLNRMHKVNEEAYLHPESRGKKAGSPGRNVQVPKDDARAPSPHRTSGFSYAQGPAFARGSAPGDLPTPQQIHEQDKYREFLKRQIEEKRLKEAEERERLRLEEEREEKKLAEQRARIQREYEQEQERKRGKEREQNTQNEEQIRLLKERRKEEERRKREEEERQDYKLRQQSERERAEREETPRRPSPPIPAVQKRLAPPLQSRPPSAVSQQSSTPLSERSMSVPPSPPVPARNNQRRAAEQPVVIVELSALRKQLHSEQRRLDRELQQTEREREGMDSPVSNRRRDRTQVDVFDMARLRLQAPVRRNSAKAAGPINPQNIRDFNRLKYRDSESREEVQQTYPDPPVDDYSLELQQQALLREQRRRISRMQRREAADYFDLVPPTYRPRDVRKNPAENLPRGSVLESDSAFIDTSGENFPVLTDRRAQPGQRTRPPSATERERGAKGIDYDRESTPSVGPLEAVGRPDSRSLRSGDSLNVARLQDRNQRRIRRLEEVGSRAWTAADASSDDGDSLPRRVSPLDLDPDRRYSVETFATEPWMRPGTSETLKRFMEGGTGREAPDWEGPSTYHG